MDQGLRGVLSLMCYYETSCARYARYMWLIAKYGLSPIIHVLGKVVPFIILIINQSQL